MKIHLSLIVLTQLLAVRAAYSSIGCIETPGNSYHIEQPGNCSDPRGCASACLTGRDDRACLWIGYTLGFTNLILGSKQDAKALVENACTHQPALCKPRYMWADRDGQCDKDHPLRCWQALEDALESEPEDASYPKTDDELTPVAGPVLAACEAGMYELCEHAAERIEDKARFPKLASAFRQALVVACGKGKPFACERLAYLEPEKPAEGAETRKPNPDWLGRAFALYESACLEGTDWRDCDPPIDLASRFPEVAPNAKARIAHARDILRGSALDLLEAYLSRRCEGGENSACGDVWVVRIAQASGDNALRRLRVQITPLEDDCLQNGALRSCVEAGRALLELEGNAAYPRARTLLEPACGKGGCSALVYFMDRTGWPQERWGEKVAYHERGCAAGETELCAVTEYDGSKGYPYFGKSMVDRCEQSEF